MSLATPGVTAEQARANIDIGGPCMVRAAAKNYLRVASVTDPADYDRIAAELGKTAGVMSLKLRFELAQKAFAHTAAYDTAIGAYLKAQSLVTIKTCYTFG